MRDSDRLELRLTCPNPEREARLQTLAETLADLGAFTATPSNHLPYSTTSSRVNIAALHEELVAIEDPVQQDLLRCALLGCLSNFIDPDQWCRCLATAVEASKFGRGKAL